MTDGSKVNLPASWRAPWRMVLGLGLLAVALSTALSGPVQGAVGEVVGIVMVVFVKRSLRDLDAESARPWKLLCAGGGAFLAGNLVRAIHGAVVGLAAPFPSPADGLFLVGYVLVVAGEFLLVRRRSADIEGDNVIDALVIAAALAALTWAFVVVPYFAHPGAQGLAKLLTGAYSVADLALIGVIVRLAVGSGRRGPSYYFLAATWTGVVATDVATTILTTHGAAGGPPPVVAVLPFVLFGAAGLHPSRARLTERPDQREVALTGRRFVLLCAALLLLPVVLFVEIPTASDFTLIVLAAGSLSIGLLVLARMAVMVRDKEHKASRERVLRDAGGALVAATDQADMKQSAVCAALELASADQMSGGHRVPVRASLVGPREGGYHVVAATGYLSDLALGTTVTGDATADLHVRDAGEVSGHRLPIDLPGSHPAQYVHAIPVRLRNESNNTLIITSGRPLGLAATRGLEALANQLSMALDGAERVDEEHRRRHDRRFSALVERSSDLVTVIGEDGLVAFASPASEQLLGLVPSQLVGSRPFDRVHPEDRMRAAGLLDFVWAGIGSPEPIEVRLRHGDGSLRWFEILADNLCDEPEVAGVVMHARDVTDRKSAELRVADSEARFRSLVQHASDIVLVADDDLQISYVSPSVERVLGFLPEAIIGTVATDLIHPDDLSLANERLAPERGRLTHESSELRVRNAAGTWITLEVTLTDLRRDKAVAGIVINARDITDRKALEDSLRHQALHDGLTGLANRTLFADRLGHALDRRGDGSSVAVLFIDLDDFKTVNDGLGHGSGDELLIAVGERLRRCLRAQDTAARLGGDEFAVLVEDLADGDQAMVTAQRILESLRQPFTVQDRRVDIGASIGVAVEGESSIVADTLLRQADLAMYRAKSKGKGRLERYHDGMQVASERLEMKTAIAEGIGRGEFVLLYQPIIDLTTLEMCGVEALARWDHPERGMLGPDSFIPLSEETGLVVPLGRYILGQACAELSRLQDTHGVTLKMNVNLSVRQLEQRTIVADVLAAIENAGIAPESLTLELTESLRVDDEGARANLIALRHAGVRIAIDDFGTGYSSFGYLQNLAVDVLKLDRSFVSPLGTSDAQPDIVAAILTLARSHGLTVIAEGIEHDEQWVALEELGCAEAQGFLFSRPVAPDAIDSMLAERRRFHHSPTSQDAGRNGPTAAPAQTRTASLVTTG